MMAFFKASICLLVVLVCVAVLDARGLHHGNKKILKTMKETLESYRETEKQQPQHLAFIKPFAQSVANTCGSISNATVAFLCSMEALSAGSELVNKFFIDIDRETLCPYLKAMGALEMPDISAGMPQTADNTRNYAQMLDQGLMHMVCAEFIIDELLGIGDYEELPQAQVDKYTNLIQQGCDNSTGEPIDAQWQSDPTATFVCGVYSVYNRQDEVNQYFSSIDTGIVCPSFQMLVEMAQDTFNDMEEAGQEIELPSYAQVLQFAFGALVCAPDEFQARTLDKMAIRI